MHGFSWNQAEPQSAYEIRCAIKIDKMHSISPNTNLPKVSTQGSLLVVVECKVDRLVSRDTRARSTTDIVPRVKPLNAARNDDCRLFRPHLASGIAGPEGS